IEIHLPPLRARLEDIPLLLDHYLKLYERKYERPERLVSQEVMDALVKHDWPGNVRALRHAAERAVIMADGATYRLEDFPLPPRPEGAGIFMASGSLNLDQLERQMIERALRMPHLHLSRADTER